MDWELRIETCRRLPWTRRSYHTPGSRRGRRTSCLDATRGHMFCRARFRSRICDRMSLRPSCNKWNLEQLGKFNHAHFEQRQAEAALDARIRSFETAFGMQREAPSCSTSRTSRTRRSSFTAWSEGRRQDSRGSASSPRAHGGAWGAIHRVDRLEWPTRVATGIRTII